MIYGITSARKKMRKIPQILILIIIGNDAHKLDSRCIMIKPLLAWREAPRVRVLHFGRAAPVVGVGARNCVTCAVASTNIFAFGNSECST